jgi:probable HAF family extracellular repeat protein
MQGLGMPPGAKESRALGVNARGQVVGTVGTPQGLRAFRWTTVGGMQDLNTLLGAGAGLVLAEALAINDLGMILAIGHEHHAAAAHKGGEHQHDLPVRIVLLVPVP